MIRQEDNKYAKNRDFSQTLGTLIFQGLRNFYSRNEADNFAEMFMNLNRKKNVLRNV